MVVPTIFSLLCGIAGWYYLLHAGVAAKLGDYERPADNRLRIRLRRWGGVGMVLIGVAFYIGLKLIDLHGNPVAILICLGSVIVLLPLVLFLAYIDLRLTRKMREAHRSRKS